MVIVDKGIKSECFRPLTLILRCAVTVQYVVTLISALSLRLVQIIKARCTNIDSFYISEKICFTFNLNVVLSVVTTLYQRFSIWAWALATL